MNHFNDNKDVQINFPLVYSTNHYLQNAAFFHNRVQLPGIKFPLKSNIKKYLKDKNAARVKKTLQDQNFDIFHPTYYNAYFLNELKNKPFIITIVDMIHEIFSEQFDPNDKTIVHKKELAQRATKIISISESTKKDIVKLLNIDESKIDVIYLGNSLKPEDLSNITLQLPERYLLFIGNRKLYKNFDRMIKAIVPILNKDKELKMICAGGNDFTNDELALFQAMNIHAQISYIRITDNRTLTQIYQNARAFIFPSLYEGFGIPVLEAFACGCPAIISHSSSLIEVGGDAVEFFDPNSDASIQASVEKVIYNDDLRREWIRKGAERLKLFSWSKMASETKQVYRSIL
jgi:glycosyltransferase involved in cell wall biosynthesis